MLSVNFFLPTKIASECLDTRDNSLEMDFMYILLAVFFASPLMNHPSEQIV